MPRVRRPLIALVVLVVVLVIGYTVRAVRDEHRSHPTPSQPPSSVVSTR